MTGIRAGVLSLLALVGHSREAHPHAVLLESSPRENQDVLQLTRVDLRFSNRIERAFSRLALAGSSREPRPLEARVSGTAGNELTASLPALAPGVYAVQWRVFTVDGHRTHGSVSFRVVPRPR